MVPTVPYISMVPTVTLLPWLLYYSMVPQYTAQLLRILTYAACFHVFRACILESLVSSELHALELIEYAQ